MHFRCFVCAFLVCMLSLCVTITGCTGTKDHAPVYQLTVDVSPDGGGTVASVPPGPTYHSGTVVTLTATANTGYRFSQWSGDLSGTGNPVTVTMDSDKTVTANFIQVYQLTVDVSPEDSGTVACVPPGPTYDPDTVVTLTATANTGYRFSEWSGDLSGTENPTTITMDSDKIVTANFVEVYQLTVVISPEDSGTVACVPEGPTYDPDTVVTLTATANTGYRFSEWSGDLSGTENPTTITMDSDKTVTANFVQPLEVEVETDSDAWVWVDYPAFNFGDDVDLYAGYLYPESQGNIYLHFDLSSIPSTATVVSAELWLYVSDTYNFYGTGYSLEAVDEPWGEYTVTWDDAPASTQMFTFPGPEDGFVGWHEITDPALTALVQEWVTYPLLNEGLAIIPLPSVISDDEIYVDSRENFSGRAPELVVYYNP